MIRYLPRAVVAIVFLVLAALPLLVPAYPIQLAGRILIFALLVISVDVLTGLTGLPTLGQVAYFGVGAYTAALVGLHVSESVLVQLAAGMAVAALAAVVTGAVAVRTSGIIFLMVTLAIGELTHQLVDSLEITGGSNGLVARGARLLPGGEPMIAVWQTYWWALAVFTAGLLAAYAVSRSPLGRSMRGVREAESRMASFGQRSYLTKLAAYTFAGALAGAAGTAWTAHTRFISPGDLAFSLSAIALLSVVLGGAGTLWGPVFGAAVVLMVREVGGFGGQADLMLGILFVAAVYLLPRGIAGFRLPRFGRRPAEAEVPS